MPGAARKTADRAGGAIAQGSPNVYTNALPQSRIGDKVTGHGKTIHAGPVMAEGSPNVFTNNIPSCRQGDAASCGDRTTGSPNVFING